MALSDTSTARFAALAPPSFSSLPARVQEDLRRVGELLWENAPSVDREGHLPGPNLDALARAGLYGTVAPTEVGGLGLDQAQLCAVTEELAGSCAATTFVWAQHLRFLRAMLDTSVPEPLRQEWREAVVAGRARAGVVLTGLMPGPARLIARPARTGWSLHGQAPWVSGWGLVDVVYVAAATEDGQLLSCALPARPAEGLEVVPTPLAALAATRTVRLGFDGVVVASADVLGLVPMERAREQSENLRLNGSFALGVARRCCALLGPVPELEAELVRCRDDLDDAGPAQAPQARARASLLAVRCADALAVARGSGSAVTGDVSERLRREASLFLVFGARPAIRQAMLARLGATPG